MSFGLNELRKIKKCLQYSLASSSSQLILSNDPKVKQSWVKVTKSFQAGSHILLLMVYQSFDEGLQASGGVRQLEEKLKQSKSSGFVYKTQNIECRHIYPQPSNKIRMLVGNKIVDHSDVIGASPVSATPTTSSFST